MYKVILSFRYLLKRRISYLAFSAVALCVFIVVVVMTVITGLVRDFKVTNHRWVGDCVVGTESLVGFAYYEDFMKKLEESDFIEGVSAVVKSYALVRGRDSEESIGVEIMGIDPVKHSRVTDFGETLYHRKNDVSKTFEPAYDPNLTGCVVGVDKWLVRDERGRYSYEASPIEAALLVSCFPLTSKGALARAGEGLVNTKTFYYSDTSHSGLAGVDSSFIYLPLEEAQLLCGMAGPVKRVSAIHIKFKPSVKLEDGREKVAAMWKRFVEEKKGEKQAELLGTVRVQSWKEYRRAFIAAMEKEQTMLTIMFALVGVTTVFIVFVVFYMIVSHKSKDVGILKSIGVSRADIIELFLCFAFLIGFLGNAVGVFGGWLFLLKINRVENFLFEHFRFQLWDRTIYAIGDIPNAIDLKVLAVIIVSAIAACLGGAFLPSRRAAKLEPVKSLQVSQL
jgi:ABC-type lipoprotein release transport system permease subunit